MYRLHKRFSALELERAYSEIEQLQVSGQPAEGRLTLPRLTAPGRRGSWGPGESLEKLLAQVGCSEQGLQVNCEPGAWYTA